MLVQHAGLVLGGSGSLLALAIGAGLTIREARRKAFNAAAGVVRARLVAFRDNPSPYRDCSVSAVELDRLQGHMSGRAFSRLGHALAELNRRDQQQRQQEPTYGSVSYRDTAPIIDAAKAVLDIVKER